MLLLLASCGGGGGGGGNDSPAPVSNPVPPAAITAQSQPSAPANNSTISNCPTASNYSVAAPPAPVAGAINGRVTFDRVPFSSHLGLGLDYASQSAQPARGVVVEAVAPSDVSTCSGSVLATAVTDGDGWYQLNPNSGNAALCVRARAQLYRAADNQSAAHWSIGVADNTDGDTLYRLNETSAASTSARARRDLYATSGWSNGAYNGTRAAAPFAILDTACKALNAVIASSPAAQFGSLTYFWSTKNTSDSNGTLAEGKVGGAFFSPTAVAIYLRGDAAVDTDEFDEMVVAHEFAHFVTYTFSRSDSIGGEHSLLDYTDPRVAFDEGWATAFAGLVLNTAIYRDSNQLDSSTSNFAHEFFFDLQRRYGASVPTGWYSEMSAQRALFKIGAGGSFNGLGVGIEGLLQAFAGAYKTSPALATLFSYGNQLKSDQPTTANAIAQIFNAEAMNGDAIQPFAETETNAANSNDLPVYQAITASSGQQTICSSDDYGSLNMLSNRRYLRFDVSTAANYSFSVQPLNAYPQAVAGFELIDRGRNLAYVIGTEGTLLNRTVRHTTATPLAIGTYVLSAFHVGNVVKNTTVAPGPQCFNVAVALAP